VCLSFLDAVYTHACLQSIPMPACSPTFLLAKSHIAIEVSAICTSNPLAISWSIWVVARACAIRSQRRWRSRRSGKVFPGLFCGMGSRPCWPLRGLGCTLRRLIEWWTRRIGVIHRRWHCVHPVVFRAIVGVGRLGICISGIDPGQFLSREKPLANLSVVDSGNVFQTRLTL
jgi:hypothetical protein